MENSIHWQCFSFDQLSLKQLYDLLALRQEVFIIEQECLYLDADGKDFKGWHLVGYEKEDLVAYTRILPKGVSYENEVSIGRVVTAPKIRGKGMGKVLMRVTLEWTEKLFPRQSIRIGAQCYLIKFYEELGFQVAGEEYLEDGIPHIEMTIEGK